MSIEQVNIMLKQGEIVQLEIPLPEPEHPWMKFAGMYKDNPLFDEVQDYIKADREQLDAERSEYYCQLDAEETVK